MEVLIRNPHPLDAGYGFANKLTTSTASRVSKVVSPLSPSRKVLCPLVLVHRLAMIESIQGRNIVITGASSGIGRAIALACAGEGANLILLARSADKLAQVAK